MNLSQINTSVNWTILMFSRKLHKIGLVIWKCRVWLFL